MEHSLLDNDVLSEILRSRNAVISQRADAYLSVFGRFSFSVITLMEIVDGFRRVAQQQRVDAFLRRIEMDEHDVLPVSLEIATTAGCILGDLHRHGSPIGRADPLIAATALGLKIPLVTNNQRHFERIQAAGYPLRLLKWRA